MTIPLVCPEPAPAPPPSGPRQSPVGAPPPTTPIAAAQLCHHDAALVDAVSGYLRAGRRAGEAGLVLAEAAEPILMCDTAGRILFANRAACATFGHGHAELLGAQIETLIPERLRAKHREDRARLLAMPVAGSIWYGHDLVAVRKDGSELPIEVALSAIQTPDEGVALALVITDVSLRNEADRKLREYQTRVQDMAFDAALVEARERRRIAADLHDSVGQSLALAQIKLTAVRARARGELRHALDEAVQLVQQAIADTRSLLFDLSPPILYDLGLSAALTWLVEQMEARHGLVVALDSDPDCVQALESDVAALLFRAVRELLMNVVKHAHTSRATVAMWQEDGQVHINVTDHGAGFDPSPPPFSPSKTGFGLFSVREQITRLGGTFCVRSVRGDGTQVSLRVPLVRSLAGPGRPSWPPRADPTPPEASTIAPQSPAGPPPK